MIDHVRNFIHELSASTHVDITKTTLANTGWFYDGAQIVNNHRTFFQVGGYRTSNTEQPIFLQREIGYLGILRKRFNGELHYLMQFKIEPGNVNCIQISPTVQATKSNFMQMHSGAKPQYLDWFLNAKQHNIIVDQIQSEQSGRFLGKRNRNIIVELEEDAKVEASSRHMWLTISQLKALLKVDNLVNMDTRTVLSCRPLYKDTFERDTPLIRSIRTGQPDILSEIYQYMNNYKMFFEDEPELVPLYSLKNWEMCSGNGIEEFVCKDNFPFKIVFCDIRIEGREVPHWGQPLFEAQGMAWLGLLTRINDGIQEFLIHAKPEIGCFDRIELGPTVQLEAIEEPQNDIEKLFFACYGAEQGVLHDVILSEEGGRFYHEQNHNVIIEIDSVLITDPPPGYWWCTYRTLNKLTQINNILNIQLRNLLALLEV